MKSEIATLYGVPHSLYTGRARSYLIKANIPYREQAPNTEHYMTNVFPLAGSRMGMPTLELADGRVIRDGAAIIDHFEAESDFTFSPTTPKQRVISRLLDVIGAEGLLRPAMHYRWNFDAENLNFLMFHMGLIAPNNDAREQIAQNIADQMRMATSNFGVAPETYDVVEQVYSDQLKALDKHLAEHPYLLGSRPSIGDFGLIAPLFGHLGRDPKPLSMMQRDAINVLRWVERMNRLDSDQVGFSTKDQSFLPDDEIPDTLISFLKTMAEDFVPETLAAADKINAWLAKNPDLESGTSCKRGLGAAAFDLRGMSIHSLAQPYRFYLLERVQSEYNALSDQDQKIVRALLAACDMSDILEAKLDRKIGRKDNLEIWL